MDLWMLPLIKAIQYIHNYCNNHMIDVDDIDDNPCINCPLFDEGYSECFLSATHTPAAWHSNEIEALIASRLKELNKAEE